VEAVGILKLLFALIKMFSTENGEVCPFNSFGYSNEDISKFETAEAIKDPRNFGRKAEDPYFVGSQTYLQFKQNETFVLDNASENKEPLVSFYIVPNKPCLAADKPYFIKRKGIDKTFNQQNCK